MALHDSIKMSRMNAKSWQRLAVLMTFALVTQIANGQQRVPVPQNTIFTAPDGAFLFSFPHDFQVCTAGKIDPCVQSFMSVCEGDALVCVIYPAKQFEN